MKKKRRRLKPQVLIVFFLGLMIFSGGKIVLNLYAGHKEKEVFDELTQIKQDEQEDNVSSLVSLKETNPDLYGWITIEDTHIDYPVMWTPDNVEYYLRKNFNGEYSNYGTPFLGYGTGMEYHQLIVYGHHMNDGTMFADLVKYQDQEYFENHQTITLETLENKSEYQIFAAFKSKAYSQEDTDVFKYYNYTDLSDETVFNEFLEQVLNASMIQSSKTPSFGDDILTLSTCEYSQTDGRFVVVAVKISEIKYSEK